ncbi:hypothetical protein FXO37_11963 [Capsicum annuum]|nr:hypothetical protein FXO37_11963 [Capsicum annuum]
MRGKQLAYPEAYNIVDRIMNLDFYKNLKDRMNKMIKYVRGKRPNPHGKRWNEAKRILRVMTMDGVYFRAVEILPEERKINFYDCNLPTLDESKLVDHLPAKVLMKQPWDFKDRIKDMDLSKNKTVTACGSHALAHIECFLIGTKMVEPMTFLCNNIVANMQEVWAYGVLTGCLEPMYKEEPVK